MRNSFAGRFQDGKITFLDKGAPTEERIRAAAAGSQYLHLATHGYFAPQELRSLLATASPDGGGLMRDLVTRQDVAGYHPGLLSGIVLAGANHEVAVDQDDGILTALEVAELDLRGVQVATLSACETGLGESAGGEGLLGLQRAFQVAGAHTTVASLWKVHDSATRALMTEFYANLWQKKLSRIEALRQAQLTMLRHWDVKDGVLRGAGRLAGGADTKNLEESRKRGEYVGVPPQYWAAFVLSGDWR